MVKTVHSEDGDIDEKERRDGMKVAVPYRKASLRRVSTVELRSGVFGGTWGAGPERGPGLWYWLDRAGLT